MHALTMCTYVCVHTYKYVIRFDTHHKETKHTSQPHASEAIAVLGEGVRVVLCFKFIIIREDQAIEGF